MYELIEDNLKSLDDQSPASKLDGDFLRLSCKQVCAKPERETKEEEFENWHGLILIQDISSPSSGTYPSQGSRIFLHYALS